MMDTLSRLGRPVIGVLLCAVSAVLAAALAAHHPWRVFVPLAFVIVIVLLAVRYGMAVSILGSAIAALIFAYWMFPPVGSVQIADKLGRTNIAWMLLASIVIPFLVLAPAHTRKPHK